jgi:hypothetical protein
LDQTGRDRRFQLTDVRCKPLQSAFRAEATLLPISREMVQPVGHVLDDNAALSLVEQFEFVNRDNLVPWPATKRVSM